MRGTILLPICLLAAAVVADPASADSQGVFELKLTGFANKAGKDSSGRCCEGYRTASGRCSGRCATKFRVCLKHYQQTIDPSNECTFGEHVTPVMGNDAAISGYDLIRFPIDFKWPGTFSLIIEAWHETNMTSPAPNMLISRLATQQRLSAGSEWTHGVHQESHSKLEYEYRMVCSRHYFGGDCDTLCRPRDDQFGHYTCDSNGEKVCLNGWQKDTTRPEGDYCTKAVCLPGCHNEHGECDRPGTCKCKQGWTGRFCDQCIRYPGCVHGSCDKPHQCNCDEGWGGLFCNQDLNYCTNHRPCQNGATCRNTGQGSYTCSCPPGYTGKSCENRISNECAHNPCLNGGTCQGSASSPLSAYRRRRHQGDDFTCVCPLGYHGRRCEKRAHTCADNPCQNGAKCNNSPSDAIGYRCNCPNDFAGVNCDIKVNSCRAAPCQNGGTCSVVSDDDYKCRCPAGFAGKNCQVNVDDCAANPCQNGGTCFDFVNDYKCYCHAGFMGRNCERNVDDCRANPCANGGTCHDSVNDFVCTCRPGYTGKDCSQEINECFSSPCMNGGFCQDRLNDFECKCLPGYSGKHCNVLPDGTVQKVRGRVNPTSGDTDNAWLGGLIAGLIILSAMLVMCCIWCNKRKQKLKARKQEEDAIRQNELNTVNCVNKTKMLDDYKIVNALDYPSSNSNASVKSINTNPNLADEELFSAKDNSYNVSKQLNTSLESNRTSLMLCNKLDNACSVVSAQNHFPGSSSVSGSPVRPPGRPIAQQRQHSNLRLQQGYNDCASSTVSSSAASSVCSSSDNNPSSRSYNCGTSSTTASSCKKYDLPTAHSVNSEAAASRNSSRDFPGTSREQPKSGTSSSPPREAYYASIDEARSSAMDDLFATEV